MWAGPGWRHHHIQFKFVKKFGKQQEVIFKNDLANLSRKEGEVSFLRVFNWKCLKRDRFSSQWAHAWAEISLANALSSSSLSLTWHDQF